MLLKPILFFLCAKFVQSVVLNTTCPEVVSRELDWKELDGKWYIAALAADLDIEGACVTLMFNHSNYTDVSISWVNNNVTDFDNGTVSITADPESDSSAGDLLVITYSDSKSQTYKFLDVDYQHYAVMFSCEDIDDGNSSVYEIWKMIRSPILKASDAMKMDVAIANYSLEDTVFTKFNNSEEKCSHKLTSRGNQHLDSSMLIITSAAAYALFRRLY